MACQQTINSFSTPVGKLEITYGYDQETESPPTELSFRIAVRTPGFDLPESVLNVSRDFLRIGPKGARPARQVVAYTITEQRSWELVPFGASFRGCDDPSNPYREVTTCRYRIERKLYAGGIEIYDFTRAGMSDPNNPALFRTTSDYGDYCFSNWFGLVLDGVEYVFKLGRLLGMVGVLADTDVAPDTPRLKQLADPEQLRSLRQIVEAGALRLDTPLVPTRISRDGLDMINRFVGLSPDTEVLLGDQAELSGTSFEVADLTAMLSEADGVNPQLIAVLDTLSRREVAFTSGLTTDETLVTEAIKIANSLATDSGASESSNS